MLGLLGPYSFENQLNCCGVRNVDGDDNDDDDDDDNNNNIRSKIMR